MTTPLPLCPMRNHPELSDRDDSALQLFADVLGVEMYRNWDTSPATTLTDAWKIRQHLDAERTRQAEADAAIAAKAAAADDARLAPIARRIETQARRAAILASIDSPIPFSDERFREWEQQASEKGEALFTPGVKAPEPDNRTPLQRLREKDER